MKSFKNMLCCDGPYNGEYVNPAYPYEGSQFTDHPDGYYECVKWPFTEELVAYWRSEMPVIENEVIGGTGGFSYGRKPFAKTTSQDCDRENGYVWDEIDAANERIRKLRNEACYWLDLRDAIEAYGVETAGELPEIIYKRHRAKLGRSFVVMNQGDTRG